MAERIMVVAEQREGKLNRVSLETLSAAQAIAKETGWTVEVVLPGYQTATLAQELAGYQVAQVYRVREFLTGQLLATFLDLLTDTMRPDSDFPSFNFE